MKERYLTFYTTSQTGKGDMKKDTHFHTATHDGGLSRYRTVLNTALRVFFRDAVGVALTRPRQAVFFIRTVFWQRRAARIRLQWVRNGVQVPAIIIFSITTKCNLSCKYCYAQALHPPSDREMSAEKIRSVIREAQGLGISFFVVAGGEPFLRPELLDIAAEFPRTLFLIFTNGLLIDDSVVLRLKKLRNVIPLVSLEGLEDETDNRRGDGVHTRLVRIINTLKQNGIFFGTSLTITRLTFDTLTDPRFIGKLIETGCRFFLFVEYTPVQEGTQDMVLTALQRERLLKVMETYHRRRQALFISVPGAEESVGGCLAAGRGFVHLTAEGDIEPCPFVPFSDTNVRDLALKDALRSDLLKELRAHPEMLEVTEGGCCLWKKRDWVRTLIPE
jgi:MoaA/NifB/PqqE/SkfB family radical SAM enzyme